MTAKQRVKQDCVAILIGTAVLVCAAGWTYIARLQEQLLDTKDQLRAAKSEVTNIREDLFDAVTAVARSNSASSINSAVLLATYKAIDPELAEIITREAVKHGTERQIHPLLVVALIKVESCFDPMAVSRAGAIGLMQIMKEHHPEKVSDDDLFHIGVNIRVGCHILAEYLKACNNNLPLALHRYLGRKAKGKELVAYQMAVLKTFFELVTAHETIRQNYLNH